MAIKKTKEKSLLSIQYGSARHRLKSKWLRLMDRSRADVAAAKNTAGFFSHDC
jgi:hypothetical protein